MTNKRIRELQKQIQEERKKMGQCFHDWGKPYYDPTTEKVPAGFKSEARGSDIWTVADGWTTKSVDQWSKVCKKCGKVESTKKKKPVVTDYEPDFGG